MSKRSRENEEQPDLDDDDTPLRKKRAHHHSLSDSSATEGSSFPFQREYLYQLALNGNIDAISQLPDDQGKKDSLVMIAAGRTNNWLLLEWAFAERVPYTLPFGDVAAWSNRILPTARDALYRSSSDNTAPVSPFLLPAMKQAQMRRWVNDLACLKQRGTNLEERHLAPHEYVFMEQDVMSAAFFQGHIDLLEWARHKVGILSFELNRYDVPWKLMAVGGPLASIDWLLREQGGHFDLFKDLLAAAVAFERTESFDHLLNLYGCRLDADAKRSVYFTVVSEGRFEFLERLSAHPEWADVQGDIPVDRLLAHLARRNRLSFVRRLQDLNLLKESYYSPKEARRLLLSSLSRSNCLVFEELLHLLTRKTSAKKMLSLLGQVAASIEKHSDELDEFPLEWREKLQTVRARLIEDGKAFL